MEGLENKVDDLASAKKLIERKFARYKGLTGIKNSKKSPAIFLQKASITILLKKYLSMLDN